MIDITTYFTDNTNEELLLSKKGEEYRLSFKDSTILNVLKESQAEWVAENLIYAANNTKYTLSEVLTLIITGITGELEKLENFDSKVIAPVNVYVNNFELG